MKGLTIGELATKANVGVETVRFYERQGLIEQPQKPNKGFRRYLPETVRRIQFVRRAKGLGFTLKEISELLDLRFDPERSCVAVREIAEIKVSDVERRIADLEKIRTVLGELVKACKGQGAVSECPILDALDEDGINEETNDGE
jgi:MerR family mercuric resistance operon transcriptional regulator